MLTMKFDIIEFFKVRKYAPLAPNSDKYEESKSFIDDVSENSNSESVASEEYSTKHDIAAFSKKILLFNLMLFVLSMWLFVMTIASKEFRTQRGETYGPNYFLRKTSEPCE
jgi:hypothetical protein